MTARLKRALAAGESVVGNWISIGHPTVAECCAPGFDFVVIDTEHTPTSLETVANVVRGVESAAPETTPLVRVPWNDPVEIKRVLDVGVGGVMIPRIESGEEARAAVEAVRYPPDGIRGIAGSRASRYGLDLPAYVESGADSLVTILQIESTTGVQNVEEIAAVDGVDALLVGPADLSASLDVFGDVRNPVFTDAVDRVLAAARGANVPVGTLATGTDRISYWLEVGFDFLIVGVDFAYLIESSARAKDAYEVAIDARDETA